MRLCRASSSDRANFLSQSFHGHTKGFSPVCIRMWALRCELLKYVLSHDSYGQQNGLGRFSSAVDISEVGGVFGIVSVVVMETGLRVLAVVKMGTTGI